MRRGFSLLEMTIALGVSGVMLAMVWQMMSASGTQSTAALVAGQAQVVARAGQEYLNANKTAVLAQAPAINDVIRIRVTSADTGNATLADLQTAGYLPASFVNQNAFGQTYALYAQRQDAGTAGADASDRMVGLLITTGGQVIADDVANQIVSRLGSAGGFFFSSDNPAPTSAATTIRGSAGGWAMSSLTSAPGWSTASGVNSFTTIARAGRLAVATSLLQSGTIEAVAGGAADIDGLTDGTTNYSTLYNVFLGSRAGTGNSTGSYNTAVGFAAGEQNTGQYNTFVGYRTGNDMAGGNNTAIGTNTMEGSFYGGTTNTNRITAIGNNIGNALWAETDNTFIGIGAGTVIQGSNITVIGFNTFYGGSGPGAGTGSTVVGADAWRQGIYNAVVGAGAGNYYGGGQGGYNAVLGAATAGLANDANNNVILGYGAGNPPAFAPMTGDFNISIGSGAGVTSNTGSNLLNIGNYIYGNTNDRQLNLGSPTLVTGIAFDTNATSSSRLATGTTAQRPACTTALEGAQRWNTQTQVLEICVGTQWMRPGTAATAPAVPAGTANPGIGYFVMTSTGYTGNLGGVAGANATCLSDLTANDWLGKAAAVAAGQLVASKVKALLSTEQSGVPQIALPLTTYYFARSGQPSTGGASFTADSLGRGPNNMSNWSGATFFNGTEFIWTGFTGDNYQDHQWAEYSPTCCSEPCSRWTSASGGATAAVGSSGAGNASRWTNASRACNLTARLVCWVHP